jgi:hypothetical protein
MTLEDILKKRFSRQTRFDVMRWLLNGQQSINKSEQMSLLSLLAYTAVETETPVEELQHILFEQFHITRVEHLKGDDYEDAMRFLMEWKTQTGKKHSNAVA